MTLQEAKLIKRTAWMQVQQYENPREATPEDERLTQIAIRMLDYVACLNYAMDDLEADLRATGQMRGMVERCFRISRRIIVEAHDAAYKMLVKVNAKASRQYNDMMDWTWRIINKCVLLEAPERSFNIVLALCRLVERLNKQLGCRYYFQPAAAIASIPSKLDGVKIRDFQIDNIIEQNTK